MDGPFFMLLFGPQGSGKGTQGERLAERYHIPLIGTGALLREEAKKDTERGRLVDRELKTGKLIPEEITNAILFDRLREPDTKLGFLLDGYPRNAVQENAFRAFLPTLRGGTAITYVIVLELSDEEAVTRLSQRRICESCGEIFHLTNKPPKVENVCDVCGKGLIHRNDDTPEAIKERLRIYRADTEPLLEEYEKQGIVHHINANSVIDDVFQKIVQVIEQH